ncbi:Hypothetical protein PBC10988_21570 [Planctomycetales bacterium 10988]|nr:Hypothetical protein PBC10988_21570 [Planctomycetales bacterium 10988]
MLSNQKSILIVGASVRAAMQSAQRAGFSPYGMDLFADQDTQAAGSVQAISPYPEGIISHSKKIPASPWIYTGALENYPRTIAELSRSRPLLGNGPKVLRKVRDPFWLAETCREILPTVPQLALWKDHQSLTDSDWLLKPFHSAAGRMVQSLQTVLEKKERNPSIVKEFKEKKFYLQQRMKGETQSALYFATQGKAVLWGVTQQLSGCKFLNAKEFHYAGSIGPLSLTKEQTQDWQALGDHLVQKANLKGVFGLDAVVNQEGIWPLEVNPRWTASVELYERAYGISAFLNHVHAVNDESVTVPDFKNLTPSSYWAKGILYAKQEIEIKEPLAARLLKHSETTPPWPCLADLPTAGAIIPPGAPILTFFIACPVREQLNQRLKKFAGIYHQFFK